MQLPTHIVVGVDGSKNSQKAVDAAALMALGSGAVVHLLYVAVFDNKTDDDSTGRVSWLPTSVAGSASEESKAVLQSAKARIPETVDVKMNKVTGKPAEEIVKFANACNAEYIVLGGRGLGLVERLLIGSVSQEVMASAKCDVVIVR